MSLAFTGPGGSTERRWIVYALLRDNVLHHLEGGAPSPRFTALHEVAAALGGGVVSVKALQIRAELEAARDALLGLPVDELAVSLRTRAALTLGWPPAEGSDTLLLSEVGLSLPIVEGANTLDDIFGTLVRELIQLTEGAGESDVVEVADA